MTPTNDLPHGISLNLDRANNYQVAHQDWGNMVKGDQIINNTWLGFLITKKSLQNIDPKTLPHSDHAERIATLYSKAMNNLSLNFYEKIQNITHNTVIEQIKPNSELIRVFVISSYACYKLKIEALLNQFAYSNSTFSTTNAITEPDPPSKVRQNTTLSFPWNTVPLRWMQTDTEIELENKCIESEKQLTEAYYFETKVKHEIFQKWKGTLGPSDSGDLEAFSGDLIESFNETEDVSDSNAFIQRWLGENRSGDKKLNGDALLLEFQSIKTEQSQHHYDNNILREKILRSIADTSRGKKLSYFSKNHEEMQCAYYANMERGVKENILGLALTNLLNIKRWAEIKEVDQEKFEGALQEHFNIQIDYFKKNSQARWRKLNNAQLEKFKYLKEQNIEGFYKTVIGDIFSLSKEKTLVSVQAQNFKELKKLSELLNDFNRVYINLTLTNDNFDTLRLKKLDSTFVERITGLQVITQKGDQTQLLNNDTAGDCLKLLSLVKQRSKNDFDIMKKNLAMGSCSTIS